MLVRVRSDERYTIEVQTHHGWVAVSHKNDLEECIEDCKIYYVSQKATCRVVENNESIVFEIFFDEEQFQTISATYNQPKKDKLRWKEDGF